MCARIDKFKLREWYGLGLGYLMVTDYCKFCNLKKKNKKQKKHWDWAQYLISNYVTLILNGKKQCCLWYIKLTLRLNFDLNFTFPLHIPVVKMTLRFLENICSSKWNLERDIRNFEITPSLTSVWATWANKHSYSSKHSW